MVPVVYMLLLIAVHGKGSDVDTDGGKETYLAMWR